MSVDEFLDWAVGRPGRYELFRGEVSMMSPETVGHAKIKAAVYMALVSARRQSGRPCHVLPDGVVIRVDKTTAFEPDALVYCGQELAPTALEVPEPLIIVDVLSQSTRRVDVSHKLTGYFRLPSVAHYLIVDPARPGVIHHARGEGTTIVTQIITEGRIVLDPPGLELAINDIYDQDA